MQDMQAVDPWRWLVSVAAALAFAWYVEWASARRGVLPPGFRDLSRRWVARAALGGVLWIGIFLPLAMYGQVSQPEEFTAIPTPRLFLLHLLLLAALLIWMLAGFAGAGGRASRPAPALPDDGPLPPGPPGLEPPLTAGGPEYPVHAEPTAGAGLAREPVPEDPVAAPASPEMPVEALPASWVERGPEPHYERGPERYPEEAAPGGAGVHPSAVELAEEPAPGDRLPTPAPPGWSPIAPPSVPAAVPAPGPRPSFLRRVAAQLGFATPQVGREIGLGVLLGIGSWAAVLAAILLVSLVIYALGGEKLLPKQPPALVPFIAGLPFGVRLLLSLSAGFVEETFFRGFLQPRIGIVLSTAMFALAHAAYGQPFMLIGITVLSLIYALLVKWRQTIWPAIAAHALFDAVQLLVVIPAALKLIGAQGGKGVAALLGIG